MEYITPISIENVILTDKPYVQSPNKINIIECVDKGSYYNINYQIIGMNNLATSIYNNDDMCVIASRRDIHTHPNYHNKHRHKDPHTWRILTNDFKQDRSHSIVSSRMGTVKVDKSNILQDVRMSPSCYDRFMAKNYTYLNIKVRLELIKWYEDLSCCSIDTGNGNIISPRLPTECNTIIFQCRYER